MSVPRAFRSPLYHASWLVPLVLIAVLGLLHPSIVLRLQDQFFDLYQRLAPRSFDPQVPVRIVDIDDASLARLGQWPWPRTRIAALVRQLAGASAIGFDIVFSEGDRTSADAFIAGISDGKRRAAVQAALGDLPGNDAVLAEALGASRTVLGLVLTQNGAAPAFDAPYGVAHAGADPVAMVPRFTGAVVPLPSLIERGAGLGAVNWLPDGDQTVRRVPLLLSLDGRLVPSLALECLRVAQGASTYLVRASGAKSQPSGAVEAVRVGAAVEATAASGDMRIHFTTHRAERFIPAWRVLDEGFDPATAAGRIVIVGSSSAGLTDIRSTPVDAAMPGVEVQAQAVESLLKNERLVRPAWWRLELVGGAALALVLAVSLPLAPAAASAAAAVAFVAAIAGASWWAFTRHGLLLDPVMPGAMALAAYGGGLSAMFRAEQRDRRFVQGAFGRFVSPQVVARLAREPNHLRLGGDLRPLTVMFTDVRNFSAFAERMNPQDLTRFMNRYLSPMSEIVLSHAGTVDKYIGDAIMAFWNAPLPDPRHAERAARAALAMIAALPDLAKEITPEGDLPLLRCGIGLASGPCVVGNLGSDLRFDYSALGDDVNLASRLESLTKAYGLDILASEAMRAATPDLAWLEIDRVVVAGREASTTIVTLVGDEAVAASDAFSALRARHGAMLVAYRERDFIGAIRCAAEIEATAPPSLTAFYRKFRARCDAFVASPPAADWEGITRVEGK